MSLSLLAVDGSAALSRGTAGRSLSSQRASVSSSWLQQKPLLLPTEQHRPELHPASEHQRDQHPEAGC